MKSSLSEQITLSNSRRSYDSITWGTWTIITRQSVDLDWNHYSKSWHRSHGPKVSIEDRSITFERKCGRGKISRTVQLDSWSGDFVANAISELGMEPKKTSASMRIRLNKAYDARLIETKRGYKFYSRTLLGQHHDYVIESPLGMTYHDTDRKALIKGLHKKIRGQARKIAGLIDWKKCKALGFCDQGIKQFCSDFGMNPKASYTAAEIHARVLQAAHKVGPYLNELKVLAEAVGYKIAGNV